jgi:ectoine hydroxylase-related dioxygenase (phytanoyl-CoA dioxygenase family)
MTVRYTIHNSDVSRPQRTCDSMLTDDETATFLRDGVVVPAYRLPTDAVGALANAVDRLAAQRFPTAQARAYDNDFAGQYLRDPHKLDPTILTVPLLEHLVADTARCLLGPRIALRNSNIRITQPGTGDATVWHTDYRPHTSPPPPLPAAPAVLTVLIYLDPADPDTGPLYVVPGSHHQPYQPMPVTADLPDQRQIVIEPGQLVFMNAALWHRGGPNHSGRIRRLITLQLATVFMTAFNFDTTLPGQAYQRLVEQANARADEPLLELLGLGGINPTSARY